MAKRNGAKKNGKPRPLVDSYRYVGCEVEPGMFREEWLVYLDTVDPANPSQRIRVQLLVDDRLITGIQGTPKRRSPAPAFLRVSFVRQEAEFAWIVLPQPPNRGSENVLVHQSILGKEAHV